MTADAPLHVRRGGRDAGPETETFLLVHGFGGTWFTWRHWLPMLARRGRVLAVDLKGFGASEKPDDGRYRPSDQVALLVDLIDREAPRHLTLIGHSYGGGIALLTALALMERGGAPLERLVVVSGAAYRQPLPPFVTAARHPKLSAIGLRLIGPERLMRGVLRSIVADESTLDDEQVRAYAEPLRTGRGLAATLDAARQIVPTDFDALVARYPSIAVPTLLLWGDRDRVVSPRVGVRLASDLPRARLEVLEGCGHIPQEERPEESRALLEAFLDAPPPPEP